MRNRIEFDNYLRTIAQNVYFQPPASLVMKYPAIVYSTYTVDSANASNEVYLVALSYRCVVFDKSPDSKIASKLMRSKNFRFERYYVSDNLNHFSFVATLDYT